MPLAVAARATFWAIPALVFVWTAHVVSTELGDPLGQTFDQFLFASASALKWVAWVGLLVLFGQVHEALSGRGAAALRAFALWAALPAGLIVVMALAREHWAPTLSGAAAHYYYDGDRVLGPSGVLAHRAAWAQHWAAGRVLLGEIALVFVFAAIHAFVGWRCGVRGLWSALFAIALCEVVLAAYLVKSPWSSWSYDFFHGDVVSSALLLDQLTIVANDPYTAIASVFYLAVACASRAFLVFYGRESDSVRSGIQESPDRT